LLEPLPEPLPEPLDRGGELELGELDRDGELDRGGAENEPPLLRPPLLRAKAMGDWVEISPIVTRPTVSRPSNRLSGFIRIMPSSPSKIMLPLSLG
jgi:hypothetical protein